MRIAPLPRWIVELSALILETAIICISIWALLDDRVDVAIYCVAIAIFFKLEFRS